MKSLYIVIARLRSFRSNPSEARLAQGMDCFFAMLIAMTLLACNMLKKVTTAVVTDKRSSSVEDERTLLANRLVQTNQHFLEWKLDSTSSNAVVMIWPKGKFTFSALQGFEGEAEKILLKSKVQTSGFGIRVKDSLVKQQDYLELEQKHKGKDQTQFKTNIKKETPAFWPILAVVLILTAGVIVYKYSTKLF